MIKICDCIMSAGKSVSCINYMNDHPDDKFIYITPYTDEARRIVDNCPALNFKEPSDKHKETGFSKSRHTAELLKARENVASTHQCFKFYTNDMLQDIIDGGYTLMIDENVSVLEEYKDVTACDIDLMLNSGYIALNDDDYHLTDKEYTGTWGREFIRLLRSRTLITVGNDGNQNYYYWAMPKDLLNAFKDIVIMTYMFEGTDMYYYLQMNGMPYVYIGVRHDETGYHFDESLVGSSDSFGYIRDKIHICDRQNRNDIGEKENALSINWFKNPKSDIDGLRSQLYNWFNNDNRGVGKNKRLWATIGDSHGKLRTVGAWNNNLAFNYRATNNYADRTILAYPANIYVNVDKKNFYAKHGLAFNEEQYALSTMIQWIWRSAIRKGEDIWVYIPSKRMRMLMIRWLDDLANGMTGCVVSREKGGVA